MEGLRAARSVLIFGSCSYGMQDPEIVSRPFYYKKKCLVLSLPTVF